MINSTKRKVDHNENLLKDLGEKHEHAEGLIEANRKRISRLQAELDALKKGGAPLAVPETEPAPIDTAATAGSGVDTEMIESL